MKKITFITNLLLSTLCATEAYNAFTMVNDYRLEAGMTAFTSNSYLDSSAYNHSYYMGINNVVGHYESQTYPSGFTGIYPTDRAYYVGYESSISENLSSGTNTTHDYKDSVSGLYSAIYHRFGFLSFGLDELGVGVYDNSYNAFYTYNMGNSNHNDLCEAGNYTGFGGYYYNVCKEDINVEASAFDSAYTDIKSQNPQIVLWPPSESDFTEPVFYEESPDPLPNQAVSGYPVSVQFNDYFIQSPTLLSFTLKEYETNTTVQTLLMNKDTDPNGQFTSHEFALFPHERLSWGGVYKAQMTYSTDSEQETIQWCYQTKDYPYKRYTITSNNQTLSVISNTEYMLYFPPSDVNDTFSGFGTYGSLNAEINFIDSNTLYFKTTSPSGYIDISLSNGMDLKLQVSSSDSAVAYEDKSTLLQNCIDGVAFVETGEDEDNSTNIENNTTVVSIEGVTGATSGWHLLGSLQDTNVTDIIKANGQVQTVWVYVDGEWKAYSGDTYINSAIKSATIEILQTIQQGQGFWINVK